MMSTATVVLTTTGLKTRDPHAMCAACGRSGTVALIARGLNHEEIEKFCRKCWPVAQRQEVEAQRREVKEWAERFRSRRGPLAQQAGPRPRVREWHWSTLPGSLWREVRGSRQPTPFSTPED